MSGHLFVCHADMTRLACDAVVVPCDVRLNVTEAWRPFLPEDTMPGDDPGWLRVGKGVSRDDPHLAVLGRSGSLTQLVVTADLDSVEDLVDYVVEAVRRAGARACDRTDHGGRVQPLVAVPLAGTGEGGLAHRRGAVIEKLLPALRRHAQEAPYDVALVLFDRRDHAAVQARREPDSGCAELGDLAKVADRTGRLAADGQLSLFVGSGVSVPVGMPSWPRLLQQLSPGLVIGDEDDLLQVAETVVSNMSETEYRERMVQQFDVDSHALGHALLAGLQLRQMVTTNYDPCLETALSPVLGADGFRVMTRSLAEGDKPWLLKLHGDIARPETLVLTASEYERLANEHPALHGVVEALMLTSHLLFVGFGLRDDDFVKLAAGVKRTRDKSREGGGTPSPAGTALALHPAAVQGAHTDGLEVVHMSAEGEDALAARRLEIFLDRVAMVATRGRVGAAPYFLDERYDDAFASPADRELRAALGKLAESTNVRESVAWTAVNRLLVELGRPDR